MLVDDFMPKFVPRHHNRTKTRELVGDNTLATTNLSGDTNSDHLSDAILLKRVLLNERGAFSSGS
jgi:hypothetical protein